MAQSDKGVSNRAVVTPEIGGTVRMYKLGEVYALIEKACDMGLDGQLDDNMTIGELDRMLNGAPN
jgi:hypothetical protein